jgi:hypothetical protein
MFMDSTLNLWKWFVQRFWHRRRAPAERSPARHLCRNQTHPNIKLRQERHIPMISLLNGPLESITGNLYKYAAPTALGQGRLVSPHRFAGQKNTPKPRF